MSEEVLTDITENTSKNDASSLLQHSYNLRVKDYLRVVLKPRYVLRKIKSRGAILILTWNFFVWSVFTYSDYTVINKTGNNDLLLLGIQGIAAGFIMPLAGWLADIHCGRFKVISWSIWMMWSGSVLITASTVLEQLVLSYRNVHTKLASALFLVLGVGFCGFQANIVQFGVDQLHDASTTEIKSFIAWYSATFLCGRLILNFLVNCIKEHKLIGTFLISLQLTVVMITYLLFKGVLIKEPVTKNPFKLVYNVIKYAVKNKHPRLRSAFTYSENYIPSRIDFGKHKYGGPFTTEQVEDVKMLFRSLVIAFMITAFYGTTYVEEKFTLQIKVLLLGYHGKDDTNDSVQLCYSENLNFTGVYVITAVFLTPVIELLIYPIFQHCLPHLKLYSKFVMGAILRIGKYITLIGLLTYARYDYTESNGTIYGNTTLLCLFQASSGSLSNSLDSRWFILPQILSCLSDLLLVITMIEFFCAQVPYSMKGIIAGITYGLLGFFAALDRIVSLPFVLTTIHWGMRTVSCGFWYLLTKLLLLVVIFIIMFLGRRWKYRKREDVLPNEHIFAEEYYSTDPD